MKKYKNMSLARLKGNQKDHWFPSSRGKRYSPHPLPPDIIHIGILGKPSSRKSASSLITGQRILLAVSQSQSGNTCLNPWNCCTLGPVDTNWLYYRDDDEGKLTVLHAKQTDNIAVPCRGWLVSAWYERRPVLTRIKRKTYHIIFIVFINGQ